MTAKEIMNESEWNNEWERMKWRMRANKIMNESTRYNEWERKRYEWGRKR